MDPTNDWMEHPLTNPGPSFDHFVSQWKRQKTTGYVTVSKQAMLHFVMAHTLDKTFKTQLNPRQYLLCNT